MGLMKLSHKNQIDYDPLEEAKKAGFKIAQSLGHVDKILLFGSAVDGKMTSDSDLDLLVIHSEDIPSKVFYKKLSKQRFSHLPLDILAKSVESHKKDQEIGGVSFIAEKEGVVIWEKPTS